MAVASLLSLGATAGAADLPSSTPSMGFERWSYLSEIRAGALVHDARSPERGSTDFNGEVLFGAPGRSFTGWDALIPRIHAGATINFAGKTSHAYAGVTWTYDLTKIIFVEATFGGSANNGEPNGGPGRNAMGCHVTFRESLSGGLRLTDRVSIMGTVEHMSNAGLCSQNRGLTNAGVRLGYSF